MKTIESHRFYSKDIEKESFQRKSFYDDLEKTSQKEVIQEDKIKLPSKKKKGISSHRWSFKINKLF